MKPSNRLTSIWILFAFCTAGCAAPLQSDAMEPMRGGAPLAASQSGYTLRLEDVSGNSLPRYDWKGGSYIEGIPGQAYAVRIDNPTGSRVEVVVTVDGRDVITGDQGDFRHQRGYIVQPWGTLRVTGFRQSLADVAQFRFTSPGDSYSARRGTPENVGVIGVAIFPEQAPPPPPPMAYGQPAAPYGGGVEEDRAREGADKSAGAPAQSNLGTQYGETHYAPVSEVSFQRARSSDPDVVLAVYYDDRAGLVRRGIVAPDTYVVPNGPQPFPQAGRFAPPPP